MSDNKVTPLRLATTPPCDQEQPDPIRAKLDEAYESAKNVGADKVLVIAWNSNEGFALSLVATTGFAEAIPALRVAEQIAVNRLLGVTQ